MTKQSRFKIGVAANTILILWLIPSIALARLAGDTNNDGKVDLTDLNLVRNNFGNNTSQGDTNGDGVVDLTDLNAVRNNFGITMPPPEPTIIRGGTIAQNTTWARAGSPYLVQGNVTIAGTDTVPAVLTIEPGVEIRFSPATTLTIGAVGRLGALVARGTAAANILMTANSPADLWYGIRFTDTTVDNSSILEYCTIEYGGIPGNAIRANVWIADSSPTLRRVILRKGIQGLTVQNGAPGMTLCTIEENRVGVYLQNAAAVIQSCTIRNNVGAAVTLDLASGSSVLTGNTYSGNGKDGLELRAGTLTQSATLKRQPVPYDATGGFTIAGTPTAPAVLTIEPGVRIRFPSAAFLNIGFQANKGILVVRGTETQRVLLTALDPAQPWYGIHFTDAADDTASILDYAVVEYTGQPGGISRAGVRVTASSPTIRNSILRLGVQGFFIVDGSPTIEACTIQDHQAGGIYLQNASCAVRNNIIRRNADQAISMDLLSGGSRFIGNSTSGNGSNRIQVRGGTLSQSRTLTKSDVPYEIIGSLTIAGTPTTPVVLTLEPGVEMRFAASRELAIGSGTDLGALVARGTEAQPIRFTAALTSERWLGIHFTDATVDNLSILEHCLVEYGGRSGEILRGNIWVDACAPTLRSLTLQKGRHGLSVSNAFPTAENITTQQNENGLYLQNATALIRNSTIQNNTRSFVSMDLASGATRLINVTHSGNASEFIQIREGTLDRSATLKKQETPYHVLGSLIVAGTPAAPAVLTIEPGVELRFAFGKILSIGSNTDPGALAARGDPANPIIFKLFDSGSAFNKWAGILFTDATVDNLSVLEHCIVEDGGWPGDSANVWIDSANPLIRSVTLRKSAWAGLGVEDASPRVENVISERNVVGIYLSSASPVITQTSAFSNLSGFFITGASRPLITKSIVAYNNDGFSLSGVGSNPSPQVNNSSIHLNTSLNVRTANYNPGGSDVVLNFQRNWWGSTNPAVIDQKISDFKDLAVLPLVDYSGILTQATFGIHRFEVTLPYFSPNGDGRRDEAIVSVDLGIPTDWTLTFLDPQGNSVRTISGSNAAFTESWNGKTNAGILVPDGRYQVRLEVINPDTQEPLVSPVRELWLDTIAPGAEITSPTDAEFVFGASKIVVGSVTDERAFNNYLLEFGEGSLPDTFSSIQSAATPIVNGTLGTWNIQRPNGLYTLRLTVEDKAQNRSILRRLVTLDNLHITNISRGPIQFNPLLGETSAIRYTLDRQASVTIKIFDLETRQLVRVSTADQFRLPGTHEELWNGRNDNGIYAPFKKAYFFTIEGEDAGRMASYMPTYSPQFFSLAGSVHNFNPYRGETHSVTFEIQEPSYFFFQVNGRDPVSGNGAFLSYKEPFLAGSHTFVWDGRDGTGLLFPVDAVYGGFASVESLPENSIILKDETRRADDLGINAYLIVPVFGEVSKITYALPRETRLTINIKDPNGNHFRTLLDNQLQDPITHEVKWDGTDDSGNYASLAGHYTVEFLAEDPPENTPLRRGNVTVAR